MKYDIEEVWFPLSEDILSWDNDFHTLMLNDHIRMIAYERAIKEVVKPGMTVVDIGTGTGILALWALQAGAKRVYGIEVNESRIPQALKRLGESGYSDKFEVHHGLSYDIDLPEQCDVVMSEILGNLADNEDMTPILYDARRRFLKKGGIMLPRHVKTSIVPISSEKAYNQVRQKKCRGINSKYNLSDLLGKLGVNNQFNLYYDCILPQTTYLSEPIVVMEFKFDESDESEYSVKVVYNVSREGVFTGFKGCFVAQLSEDTILDISGGDIRNRKTADCWKHCYLPIENPVEVKKGDIIELVYSRRYPETRDSPFRQFYSWRGCVKREGKIVSEFDQDMGEEND